jgi:ubiquinone biosynthesis protein COQ9
MSLNSLASRTLFLNSSLLRFTRTTFVLRRTTAAALYHSYDHPSPPPYPPAETSILSAALLHIPTHGFSDKSLVLGARDAGYLPVSVNLLPRGVFELVMFWLVSRRLGLKETLDGNNGGLKRQWEEQKMGVGGRVRSLVLERLRMNERAGTVGKWQEVCNVTL